RDNASAARKRVTPLGIAKGRNRSQRRFQDVVDTVDHRRDIGLATLERGLQRRRSIGDDQRFQRRRRRFQRMRKAMGIGHFAFRNVRPQSRDGVFRFIGKTAQQAFQEIGLAAQAFQRRRRIEWPQFGRQLLTVQNRRGRVRRWRDLRRRRSFRNRIGGYL